MKKVRTADPQPDRARDYRLVLERWLRVCGAKSGLAMRVFAEADGYPLAVVGSEAVDPGKPSLYLSAGIHGDEPAPVEALIGWAEGNQSLLSSMNLTVFPCLNPWGLERNIRFDREGRDLNRCYNSRKVPRIAAQREVLRGRRYDLAASLHEDYDARGFYLYEIAGAGPYLGEGICGAVSGIMTADPRVRIDGHRARGGLIRRKIHHGMMRGHPEAFFLHFGHASRTLTFETPSEEALSLRVSAQKAFLDAVTVGSTIPRRQSGTARS